MTDILTIADSNASSNKIYQEILENARIYLNKYENIRNNYDGE